MLIIAENEKSYWEQCEELFEAGKVYELEYMLEQIDGLEEYEQEKVYDAFFKTKNNSFFAWLNNYFYMRELSERED